MTVKEKFRCSRCRKHRDLEDSKIVLKVWRTKSSSETQRMVRVCSECASRKRQKNRCALCADLPHRVVGPKCRACGGLYRAESVKKDYPVGQSALGRF